MAIHHDFEMTSEEFKKRIAWPLGKGSKDWHGEYASQSPLNKFYIARDGGGANGTSSYLALPGDNVDQFYVEATPQWYRPRECHDLRDTRARIHLKSITTTLRVNEGYAPHLFIDDYRAEDNSYCGWYVKEPLRVGSDWTFNRVDLLNDELLWVRYASDRSLDHVLSHVGFIGVMYFSGIRYTGVGASGILGIDEFSYKIPIKRA